MQRVRTVQFQQKYSLSILLQFFKTIERTLSSSCDSRNSSKCKWAPSGKGRIWFSCVWHPSKGSFKREKKQKKAAPKSGPRLHEVEQPQRGEERPHGASSNIFSITCVCERDFLFLSLTSSLASLLAPASNKSCTVAVWPSCEAPMSAVRRNYKHKGRKGTIHATSENCAHAKWKSFHSWICNPSKVWSAFKAPPMTLLTLQNKNMRIKKIRTIWSSCIWHP